MTKSDTRFVWDWTYTRRRSPWAVAEADGETEVVWASSAHTVRGDRCAS